MRACASMRAECLFLRARAFDKQLQKFCEHEHPSSFWEQFEQRSNFASTFKLNETIVYPSNFLFAFHSFIPRVLSVSPLRVGFSRENRPFSSRNGVCSPASVAPFQTFQLFSVFHCTKNSKRSLRSEKVHRDHSATSFAYDHDRLPSLLSGR